jgi:deoxyadenosine/deoxycytidine kinase
MARIHIAIEGLSAAGKTDVGSLLAKPPLVFKVNKGLPEDLRKVRFFEERVNDNPYKKDFYESGMMEVYALMSQIYYLQARVVTGANIMRWDGGIAIEDRSIFGDATYEENLYKMKKLSKKAHDIYCNFRKDITEAYKIREPDGILMLDISLKTCIKRLKERKTGETLDFHYWGNLLKRYKEKFRSLEKRIPIEWVDANPDYFQDEQYMEHVAERLNTLIKRIIEKNEKMNKK